MWWKYTVSDWQLGNKAEPPSDLYVYEIDDGVLEVRQVVLADVPDRLRDAVLRLVQIFAGHHEPEIFPCRLKLVTRPCRSWDAAVKMQKI